jgi:putative nucleotidyltransferase with HDIG domain
MKRGAVDFLKKPFDIDELLFKADFYLCDETASGRNPGERETNHLNAKKEELLRQSYIYDNIDNTGENSEEIFQKIVELSLRVVDGDSCALFLYDEEINEFYPKVVRNNGNGIAWHEAVLKLVNLFTEVVDKKDAVMIHSDRDPLIAPSLICAPLMIKDNVLGVLCIRKKKNGGTFNNNDLHHVLSLAKRASLNIENRVLYESIYRNLMDTFKSLVASIQMRDFYTEEHSYRVADLAVKIAEGYGCSANEIASLRIASLLHDVGKISVPDNILLKRDMLSTEEYEIIKNHPSVGEEMLSTVLLFDKERNIIRHHHERWDGTGYPSGLSGERIPLLARILAVADSYDAMTNDRPYRKGMSVDHAIMELKKNGNIQLDRKVVDIFLNVI